MAQTTAESVHSSSSESIDDASPMTKCETASSIAYGVANPDARDVVYNYPTTDRADLNHIATVLSRIPTRQPPTLELTKRQTSVADVQEGDPRLNPTDPAFNFHFWARYFSKTLEREGLKRPSTGFVFKNLNVSGTGAAVHLQRSVGSILMTPFGFATHFKHPKSEEKLILKDFNGSVRAGEMLIVLGRPGSGCTTFLKSICGELRGLKKSDASTIHYNGIPQDVYVKELRGEVLYNQETEKHFPRLTVGQTLRFAAAARTPAARIHDLPRDQFATYATEVAMNLFGLSHVRDTIVGNDFIRGVSGGERKRVSIAEMFVSGAPVGAWDNSTRGLDAATALDFVRCLRVSADFGRTTHAVAVYQASQAIYDTFDKVVVLYEGRQIYFGPTDAAKAYFEDMGWLCPPRQTTGDFLTSVTNPTERIAKKGFESKVPRTPVEFEKYWHESPQFQMCLQDISEAEDDYPVGGPTLEEFRTFHHRAHAKHMRPGSVYRISVPMQVKLCVRRAYQRLWNNRAATITTIATQVIQSLIIGSIFNSTPANTTGFFAKGSILFFAVLMNALQCVPEISALFAQRPIVEKHNSYAFYHPFAEALASIIADLPIKLVKATVFNVILYFLGDLRRSAEHFFIFYLFTFVSTLAMSGMFRTIAAVSRASTQAMSLAGILILAIVIYTGFTLQKSYMHPWFEWLTYVNPVAYAYEALLVNEVHGRGFPCSPQELVPPYGPQAGTSFRCAVKGSLPDQMTVSGDAWALESYGYSYSHLWRNLGIIVAFMVFFYATHLVAVELNSNGTSAAEYLVFRRGHLPSVKKDDEETSSSSKVVGEESSAHSDMKMISLAPQKDIFTWRNVSYDVSVKGHPRRLLDNVSGWVKPGTMTALMGVSGAGKTTLLDTLAQRVSVGVVTGDMLVNGRPLDSSFQRKTGYVQQQDLHLETATVREALRFSAMLRQPKSVPVPEKYAFVEEVIEMLGMQDFSEAIVGVPGEGLNVEQRKLLTIGVELAAKPALLLFLDEPTSGLDSQSSWSIIALLRKLADNGQAVLSTIHQPSAMLFQQFDRLLFLAKGGRTVYFGDIGANSRTLLDYFEKGGARRCTDDENPAEYMLEIIGVGSNNKSEQDWPAIWGASEERQAVHVELDRIQASAAPAVNDNDEESTREYALPLALQVHYVTKRVFQQYWRTPQYVMGKVMLCLMSALFVGFSFFLQDQSRTGMQNTLFAIFMIITIFTPLCQQIMPRFVMQRSLYEVRERPSKTYSWIAFIWSNIVVELPYQIVCAVLVFAAWFFTVFGTSLPAAREAMMLAFLIVFYMFTSTFAYMVIAALPDAETAANIATLLFGLSLTFSGVLQTPDSLPQFWMFMWRVSPFTYMIGGWAGTGLENRPVVCAANELAVFTPPANSTCASYLARYFEGGALGYLIDPSAVDSCQYCPLSNGNQFLALSDITPDQKYRNLGIGFAYVLFNTFAAILLYYLFRVKKISPRKLFASRKKASTL